MNLLRSLGLSLFIASCTGTITSEPEGQSESTQVREDEFALDESGRSIRTHYFQESTGDIANPERGFYVGVDLFSPGSIASIRDQGSTLAIALVRLDSFRTSALSAAFLNDLAIGFQGARENGIKVVLRFMYNSSFTADASRAQILAHITQLAPVLQANADVIAVMQAGFIGAWGEWHGSTNGLDNFSDRTAILDALLVALPDNRAVQVRTPMFKRDIWNAPTAPDSVAVAADQARVGHHNDCFLASESDFGTFSSPLDDWRNYLANDTQVVPMGGETCVVNAPRTDCQEALADMAGFHFSYLNRQYKVEVLSDWEEQGCMDEVESRLGYRLVLDSVSHPEVAVAGETIEIELALNNRGFAAPFNERPVHVVLRGANSTYTTSVKVEGLDPRKWAPGVSNVHTLRVNLPADMAADTYSVALSLPDAAAALAEDPRYSVRFANEGTWQDAQGENVVIPELVVGQSSASVTQTDGGSPMLLAAVSVTK